MDEDQLPILLGLHDQKILPFPRINTLLTPYPILHGLYIIDINVGAFLRKCCRMPRLVSGELYLRNWGEIHRGGGYHANKNTFSQEQDLGQSIDFYTSYITH